MYPKCITLGRHCQVAGRALSPLYLRVIYLIYKTYSLSISHAVAIVKCPVVPITPATNRVLMIMRPSLYISGS